MNRPAPWRSMMVGVLDRRPFKVGRATVDPVSRDASWQGGEERLQPQTLKVLLALMSHRGEVVTRDELIQLCWDGRIVGDDVINRSILLLRQFAERAGGFKIETVPRAGYRLLDTSATTKLKRDGSLWGGVQTWPIGRRQLMLAGGGAALAAATAGGWFILRPDSSSASKRIAVLPFANLTGDPAQVYFSDGIAEELRAALSRIGMQVIGKTSSDAVRNLDAKTAATKLGVANILTGSVRRSPTTIRIDAQLIGGSDGVERWSQSYDRAPGDVIKIQTDIAEKVATALGAALGTVARNALTAGGTQNPEAQTLLLQALAAARAGTQAGCQRALSLLDAATAADESYADAYARKSYFLEFYVEYYANTLAEVNSYRSDALRSARIALRIAPNLSRAHWALAQYLAGILEIRPADAEYRKAIELAPGDAGPLSDYSLLVLRIRSAREALALANRALSLDPLDPDAYRRRFLVLYYRREFAKAVAFSKNVEQYSPELFIWPAEVGLALILLNRLEDAERYLERGGADYYERLVGEAVVLIRKGRPVEAKAKLTRFRQLFGDLDNYQYAQIYAQFGDKDRAFSALDRAWSLRDTGLLWLRVDPLLDPIRNDARFVPLLRRMGLPTRIS